MYKLHTLVAIAACLPTCLMSQFANAQFLRGFVRDSDVAQTVSLRIASLEVIDMDGDGDLDIVVLGRRGFLRYFEFFTNDGSGNFTYSSEFQVNDNVRGIAIKDLNNDGLPEIVVGILVPHEINVYLNLGGFSFLNSVNFPNDGIPGSIKIQDIDADGDQDILATTTGANSVQIHLGNGSGTVFGMGGSILTGNDSTTGLTPSQLMIADLNGDTHLDMVTKNINSDDFSILYGLGNGLFWGGLFTTIVPHGTPNIGPFDLVDFNNDGMKDIVFAIDETPGMLKILYNDYNDGAEPFPNFNWFSDTIPTGNNVKSFRFAEIDCTFDSRPDLVTLVTQEDLGMDVHLGLGSESFSVPVFTGDTDSSSRTLRIADIDNDGDNDILIGNTGNIFQANTFGNVFIYINRCNESPCPADLTDDRFMNFFDVSAFLSAFSSGDPIADFNGDGAINFFDVSAFLDAFEAGRCDN